MITAAKRFAYLVSVALCMAPTQILAAPMTSQELKNLYSKDVTECGFFPSDGTLIPYCEHFRKDGKIFDPETQEQIGVFRIDRKNARVCLNYQDTGEACGTYHRKSGDAYNVEFYDGNRGDVTITNGLK